MDRTVMVSGEGTVSAAPDQAHISAGVVTDAKTAQEALAGNTAAMAKVIAAIKAQEIDARDLQTSQLHIEPITVYSNDGKPPQVTGYRAQNSVSIQVRKLATLGAVMDALVAAGANQMQGLTFSVSNEDALRDEARKRAMVAAQRRAKILAEAVGASVGDILSITEGVESHAPGPVMMRGGAAFAEAGSVPIEQGSQQITAHVTTTWKLK